LPKAKGPASVPGLSHLSHCQCFAAQCSHRPNWAVLPESGYYLTTGWTGGHCRGLRACHHESGIHHRSLHTTPRQGCARWAWERVSPKRHRLARPTCTVGEIQHQVDGQGEEVLLGGPWLLLRQKLYSSRRVPFLHLLRKQPRLRADHSPRSLGAGLWSGGSAKGAMFSSLDLGQRSWR
jgi:hypothetical protein